MCTYIVVNDNEIPKNNRIYPTSITNADWNQFQNYTLKRILVNILGIFLWRIISILTYG